MKNNNLIVTLAILLAFVLGSCAATSLSNIKTEKERLSQKIYSAEEYSKKCLSPSDYHSVGGYQFALESRVFRHENCLGVDDMLMIMWADEPTDRNTKEVKKKMLALSRGFLGWIHLSMIEVLHICCFLN